jgi:hypothetical protein
MVFGKEIKTFLPIYGREKCGFMEKVRIKGNN